jgi:large subunit ribosomal protein L1
MAKRSKRYRESLARIDSARKYPAPEAVALLKTLPGTKFNQTVELALRLNIDTKQSDQMIRGSIGLPKGTGKDVRVIAFCDATQVEAAKEAGAIEAGIENLVKKIEDGWTDFDVAVASPDMMRHVGKLGRILGPQGKMPSPKSGTVTPDVAKAVSEFRAGKIEFRADSSGNVHAPVGRLEFSDEDLVANIEALIGHIQRLRPASVKGTYLLNASLSASMSPGVPLAV